LIEKASDILRERRRNRARITQSEVKLTKLEDVDVSVSPPKHPDQLSRVVSEKPQLQDERKHNQTTDLP